jgi:hypothetical protein
MEGAKLPLTLRNKGNTSIQVSFKATGDGLGVTWTGAPAAATIAPGATLDGAFATFAPSKAGPVTGSATMTVQGALCGAAPKTIPMRAEATTGNAQVAPGSLDFRASCGADAPAPSAVTITNHGQAPLDVTQVVVTGAFKIAAGGADAHVAAGAQTTISIAALAAAPGDAAAGTKTGTLTFKTSDPKQPTVTVALTETIVGASLAVVDDARAAVSSLDFGTVDLGTSKSLTFNVANNGNDTATITPVALTAPFGWTSGASRPVAAGDITQLGVTFVARAQGLVRATAQIAAGGAICVAPTPVALAGTGGAPPPPPPPPPRDAAADGPRMRDAARDAPPPPPDATVAPDAATED